MTIFHSVDADALGTEEGPWRIVGARVQGPAHEMDGRVCEDSFAFGVRGSLAVAVVCDGAGSALFGRESAVRFSGVTIRALLELHTSQQITCESVRQSLIEAIEAERERLNDSGLLLDDHDTTLVAVVADSSITVTAHVGDGLAGIAPTADWRGAVLSRPENGEYANETWFVTVEDWKDHLRCMAAPALEPGGVAALTTDGAMPFVIGPGECGLDPDFMGPVSRFFFSAPPDDAAILLQNTLNGRDARRISRDDKTFV
jgi:Protein phosphatase 2C